MNRTPRGFTLIELVIVIVVLGILAVTAMPRLINLQSDARIAALEGLKAGMQSASDMVHPIAIREGKDTLVSSAITVENDTIQIAYGYPAAYAKDTWAELIEATFTDSTFHPDDPGDWYFSNPQGGDNDSLIYFMHKSRKLKGENCYLQYNEASATTPPSFELETSGC